MEYGLNLIEIIGFNFLGWYKFAAYKKCENKWKLSAESHLSIYKDIEVLNIRQLNDNEKWSLLLSC